MENMITIDGLTKNFGSLTAVNQISLTVKRGEVLGFLGPNGAGKSTTMKMLTGYLPITSGKASICGFDVITKPIDAKKCIGYLPEGSPLYGDMSCLSFLDFVAEIRGFSGNQKKESVNLAIERLELGSVVNKPIETLSKGFKRRVGLAQSILHDPEVLILDEPTDGLDPNQKHHVRQLINEMAKDKAIIVSTHILEEVEAVCTDAVIIAEGKLLEQGTPEQLLGYDAHHNSVIILTYEDHKVNVREALSVVGEVIELSQNKHDNGLIGFRILANEGTSSLVQANRVIREKNLPVEEVYLEKGALDKVFREITTSKTVTDAENA